MFFPDLPLYGPIVAVHLLLYICIFLFYFFLNFCTFVSTILVCTTLNINIECFPFSTLVWPLCGPIVAPSTYSCGADTPLTQAARNIRSNIRSCQKGANYAPAISDIGNKHDHPHLRPRLGHWNSNVIMFLKISWARFVLYLESVIREAVMYQNICYFKHCKNGHHHDPPPRPHHHHHCLSSLVEYWVSVISYRIRINWCQPLMPAYGGKPPKKHCQRLQSWPPSSTTIPDKYQAILTSLTSIT